MRRFAMIGALVLLTVCGCKKGPSFVGTWTTDMPNFGAQTVHLNEDKTVTAEATKSVGQVTLKISAKGTWSNTDTQFTLTVNDIKIDGLPAQLQALADKQVETMKGKPQVGTYKWDNDDQFTLTSGNTNQVFKRVKS